MNLTFCTISNNLENIDKIINNHNQSFPLIILYYDKNENDIIKINNEKLCNVTVYYSQFNNDYASLWNNVFSRVSTDYIFWFHDTDIISQDCYEYFSTDIFKNILSQDKPDVLNIRLSNYSTNNSTPYYEDRILRRTLYPLWKERALPRLSYDSNPSNYHNINGENVSIISTHIYYDKTEPLFNLMFDNNENFSIENLLVYTKLIVDNPNLDKIDKIYQSIINNDKINKSLLNILLYNMAYTYYKCGEYMNSKRLLSQIDSSTELHTIYYCYLLGKIYESMNQYKLSLRYYEIVLSEDLYPLSYLERKYLYESEMIIPSSMGNMAGIYTMHPELYENNVKKENGEKC